MKAIDFFCGAGGLTRGLLDGGLDVVAGIDSDDRCQATYERNNSPARFHHRDIRTLLPADVFKILGSRRRSDLLFAGCAPCSPFSSVRKDRVPKDGRTASGAAKRDLDATLLGAFARLIVEILPEYVLVENVPGLTRVGGFSTYRRFLAALTSAGYGIAEGVIDAKHYGIPQSRRRYVLIALRGQSASLPARTHGPKLERYLTVKDAIWHYPSLEAGCQDAIIANHFAATLTEINVRRLKATPLNGGDRRSWPAELVLKCHQGSFSGHTDVYGRMAWHEPAPTLTGKCHSISNGRYGHPEQERAISLREAASLQTFSDSYLFFGSHKHIAQQIGNAVPVKLGEVLGRHILELARRFRS